jgi:hypothetical protein
VVVQDEGQSAGFASPHVAIAEEVDVHGRDIDLEDDDVGSRDPDDHGVPRPTTAASARPTTGQSTASTVDPEKIKEALSQVLST